MDFFESQDLAKRNTGRLFVLFVLAVISLVIITNLLVMAVFGLLSFNSATLLEADTPFNWQMFLYVSLAVIGVILAGSLYKLTALAGGGARVAEMLDGRLLIADTEDLRERQLLNIVEEMAIASGTPVPPVYLLEEQGINAFAAGYSPGDAVIGVTRGATNSLSRDELQGVIAHEFSHILHGDIRINIRLIAVLHGILILGIIGYHLMRGGSHSRRSKDSGGIVMLGLGLLVIGYVGTFFGNLIKAAVSRQREYLADASAVQYTRNPEGIAGALMRIATHDRRSYLDNPNGMEISHALFEEGTNFRLRQLYATHPPIENRILAILPGWDGNFEAIQSRTLDSKPDRADPGSEQAQGDLPRNRLSAISALIAADTILGNIGQPGPGQLEQARKVIGSIPRLLLDAAHEPTSARALVYLILLDGGTRVRQKQLQMLTKSSEQSVMPELSALLAKVDSVTPEFRLTLLSLAVPQLRQLSKPQFTRFSENLHALIQFDGRIQPFEWAILKIVDNSLGRIFAGTTPPGPGRRDLSECRNSLEVMLSVLAYADRQSKVNPEAAFDAGTRELDGLPLSMKSREELNISLLNTSLEMLSGLKPLQKPAVLKACLACIRSDQTLAPVELELLRAIGLTLDCPIPPLSSETDR